MKTGDLTRNHLGRTVTLVGRRDSPITGTLGAIYWTNDTNNPHAITDEQYHSLTIDVAGHWTVCQIDTDQDITIHEDNE